MVGEEGGAVVNSQREIYFEYLDRLRKSGLTNMFAAVSYLQAEFDIPTARARAILDEWMREREEAGAKS